MMGGGKKKENEWEGRGRERELARLVMREM